MSTAAEAQPTSFDEAVDRLPKVELHCHVEGTMRLATLIDLARRNHVTLPTADPTELYRYTSLDSFLEVFWLVQSTLGSRDDWARLAYESVKDAAGHGRVYAETFFTPARHLAAGQRLSDVVAGLSDGIDAAEDETGSRCMLVCDIDRAFGPGPASELVDMLAALRAAGAPGMHRVIGVGMDSTEAGVDPCTFAPAFARARAAGFRRTAHQGEDSGPDAIATCVDQLGAERIDHGLTLGHDASLVRRFAAERIPLTMCPSSNIVIANRFTRLEDHPIDGLRAAGVLATVNTDDPALTDLDLGSEYCAVAHAFGWSWSQVVALALDGVEASWLDDDDKGALATRVTESARTLQPS